MLEALITETGAVGVHWSRLYDPAAQARDRAVKAMLRARGVAVVSHAGHLLHEPWQVATGQGGSYRVYTPFWQAVKGRDPGAALSPPKELRAPKLWPVSAALTDWQLGAGMGRGAAVVAPYQAVGEATALARLDQFLAGPIDHYASARDRRDLPGTSRLSENLTYRKRFIAELSPAPGPDALAWFATVPQSWALDPAAPYPAPMIDLAAGRARALAAYGTRAAG
ncbi:MAG: deoxyribodipyrimidine photo-lyase [Pseudorhodobacter sp.]|nr:deoxyribodipyrimidine photo-lyase [Pseudorhodobacter sp.]